MWLLLLNPFHIVDVPRNAVSGKLDFYLLDFVDSDLLWIDKSKGEEAVGGRLVVGVCELVIDHTLAHELNFCKMMKKVF